MKGPFASFLDFEMRKEASEGGLWDDRDWDLDDLFRASSLCSILTRRARCEDTSPSRSRRGASPTHPAEHREKNNNNNNGQK